MKFGEYFYLNEVVNLGSSLDDYIPLKDNYTITVYHGLDNNKDLYSFLKYGTTGKMRAGRSYSYEANNNPYGLFVTINFRVAKEFTRKYLIEFHTKVSDLEAPVWPGTSYTIQGQEAQYWNDDEDRKNRQIELRNQYRNNKYDFISKSDRPELADTLYLNAENQALYTGNLDPNSIKAIWVKTDPKLHRSPFIRYERREFLKKFGKELPNEGYKTDRNSMGGSIVLKPRDEVTIDNLFKGLNKKFPGMFKTKESFVDGLLKRIPRKEDLYSFVWPHQIDETWEIIQSLK